MWREPIRREAITDAGGRFGGSLHRQVMELTDAVIMLLARERRRQPGQGHHATCRRQGHGWLVTVHRVDDEGRETVTAEDYLPIWGEAPEDG